MAMMKIAQNLEDLTPEDFKKMPEDDVVIYDLEKPEEIEVSQEIPNDETILSLPPLPGSDNQTIEVSLAPDEPETKQVKEHKDDIVVADPWDHSKHSNILDFVKERFSSIPKHSGEYLGILRACSYLKKLNSKLSRIVEEDVDGKISITDVEKARQEIESAISRLEDAAAKFDKKKSKKAEQDIEFTKTADKSTKTLGNVISVPLIVSTLARIIINAGVSSGKDIERSFHQLSDKYQLSNREQLELCQVLMDFGLPIQMDRGLLGDAAPKTFSEGYDHLAQYSA